MQFDASYTFSKLITTGAEDLYGGSPVNQPQNPYDRSRFISPNSTPHVFVFNYILELPFGRGRRFLDHGGIVNALVGGWQVGGIHRYQTGSPLVVSSSRNGSFLNLVGFAGTRGAQLRPNLTGQNVLAGNDPSNTSFRLLNGLAFTNPPNFEGPPTTDVNDPRYAAYYANPARFFGTAPAVIEEYVFPLLQRELSILKRTSLSERVRWSCAASSSTSSTATATSAPTHTFNNFDVNNPNSAAVSGISGLVGDPTLRAEGVQVGAKIIF